MSRRKHTKGLRTKKSLLQPKLKKEKFYRTGPIKKEEFWYIIPGFHLESSKALILGVKVNQKKVSLTMKEAQL